MPRSSWFAFLHAPAQALALALSLFALGCHTVPEGRSAVDEVAVIGAKDISSGDVEDKIATTENPKFFGLFPGFIYEYSIFDRNVLAKDLQRVELFYRSKGFYDAHARAGRIITLNEKHVRVEVVVDEGKPVLVRTVRIDGIAGMPKDIPNVAGREAGAILVAGKPFEEENFDKTLDAVKRVLTDRGYAYTKVTKDAVVDVVAKTVDVTYTVTPGEPQVFGEVTVEGLGPIPEKPIRRALNLTPGDTYSSDELDAARQAVLDLGVFASVDVTPVLADPPRADHVVPVKVHIEAAKLRTVKLGGGVEFDVLKSDLHAIAGWTNRNFFGGLRSFSVTFSPGVVLYPLRFNNLVIPNKLLPQAKMNMEFKQPGFPEARTNLFIRPGFDVQALLLDENPPPDARVVGYAEAKAAVGLERSYGRLYAAISQNGQFAYPFSYVGTKDPSLGNVLISYPELLTQLDFRDDRTHPRKGVFLGHTLQVAGGPFGGDAKDVKTQPEIRTYVPIAKKVVWASRGAVGFLFAQNYGAIIKNQGTVESPVDTTRDYQLTYFRGLFSGGPTSNRGYPLRGVGPHADIPFISPAVAVQQLSQNCGGDCRQPTGGFSLWEASTELRFGITGPLSIATFCDTSDVSPRQVNLRFSHLHLSCGAGGRYDTPVGPIRLDVGVRIPGLQILDKVPADEREPDSFAFGIPIAVSFGIGEAY